jgi:hypothetical protein
MHVAQGKATSTYPWKQLKTYIVWVTSPSRKLIYLDGDLQVWKADTGSEFDVQVKTAQIRHAEPNA